ncbi:MAG: HTTM domain-containing protein [Gemmatimonadales bacterium]|nr:HTTM domain-containing protein [Gemmatimonadales bacterium]
MSAAVGHWMARWDAFWFPSTTTRPLGVARIITVAAQLFWFFPSLDKQLNLIDKNPEFLDPQLLIQAVTVVLPRSEFFTPATITSIYWITAAAGLLALVGWFTRTSLLLFAAGIWFLVAHEYSYGDRHHHEAVFSMFLMALPFAPSGGSFSVDALLRRRRKGPGGRVAGESERTPMAMWPLRLLHVLLAMTYLSTGVSKLVKGGLQWMNGYTLQSYTFADALNRGLPVGLWLAQQHTLAIALSVFTILFETFFFVSILVPWTAPLFLVNGILFQLGLYVAAGHSFFEHIVMLVVVLVCAPPLWLRAYVERVVPGRMGWWSGAAQAEGPR